MTESSPQHTADFHACADPLVPALLKWATDNGIQASKLQVRNINNRRGMVADRKVRQGRSLLSIPRSASLVVSPGEPSPFPNLLPDEAWSHMPEYGLSCCLSSPLSKACCDMFVPCVGCTELACANLVASSLHGIVK